MLVALCLFSSSQVTLTTQRSLSHWLSKVTGHLSQGGSVFLPVTLFVWKKFFTKKRYGKTLSEPVLTKFCRSSGSGFVGYKVLYNRQKIHNKTGCHKFKQQKMKN